MKIIIFGLGNFGTSLAMKLTESGNEVIGVDLKMEKVNLLKDKIAHAICLDATNELAYDSLPLKDAHIAIVAIGENEGAAIITTAILKDKTEAKIISRSLSPVHDTVLKAMGIKNIIHPEQEAAANLTGKINLKNVLDNFNLDDEYSISEIQAKDSFEDKTLQELDFRKKYNLNVVTIIRPCNKKNFLGNKIKKKEVIGLPDNNTRIQKNDLLIVFGRNEDISNFGEEISK
ncbi:MULTISPECIES: potassium channel family protein [Galbibacter]|uniref:TrkA family potassium uptake protein n=1 Tax=Galbibacter pacificus TaxID=2996052 RepID=A0ABT6FU05_9FLAO|nr:TrkA family potassium uptake protein [Galbibacter pacificus]MDG3583249.1 TrkA family potassium uptake protein [Galbibacter pacificus]MDG3586730.1 TrkA family potassium uptake protein [Galbibacter pacificus]